MQTTGLRILLYDWNSQSQPDLRDGLDQMEDAVYIDFQEKWNSYDDDPVFEEKLASVLREQSCQICLSFNYFPVISKVCQREQVIYCSWIYDAPHTTLYSETVLNDCNRIFTFDKNQERELLARGVKNVYHLPLAVNVERLDKLRMEAGEERISGYAADIAFVGSLYENNFYQRISYLPPRLKGYLEGVGKAQQLVYGASLLEDLIDEHILEELREYVKLNMDEAYHITYKQLFLEQFLKKYISSEERKECLQLLGKITEVHLYSGSAISYEGVKNLGYADYRTEMPLVFAAAKLNLNLTIRSISSGIPLRALDIMGAGGVLFSNIQPELMEYFVPEEEWICFESQEEMLDKAAFYLQNDEARKKIGEQGYQKVKKEFSYRCMLNKMFQMI